jgi:hypothetical protein
MVDFCGFLILLDFMISGLLAYFRGVSCGKIEKELIFSLVNSER